MVLADDHAVVRSGLRLLLESDSQIAVVAEAGDMTAADAAVRSQRPDVLVLDLHMPGEASLPAIPRLRADCPGTAVVVLTAQRDPSYAGEALRLGATGYVPKEAAGRCLLEAIRTVAGGGTYLEPELGARLAATTAAAAGAAPELTARELEVLRLIARGLTNREIAERLFLSVRTIESHRARIQRKLGRSRRSDLVDYAIERGLVEPADLS
ncbi:response regulator transcription factor [Conexibacter sp. JD483]|uniref:response regulator n=1 Tax=unclassified Conexibacter TaxID=2627773 RepID=UPI00271F06B6|nr:MULTISPECIES: response regulator transcription factor [unclassified Conexibacter]MDO8187441.1 response regulator transcription factor [Conexibacter sp. CPCC 205706]MDO8198675.1 response regulator transcription factor [Conexibacter sp. CPCC 205762]MDR9369853.1 response regulator transcription factor [Conexibacter sp. JD483]